MRGDDDRGRANSKHTNCFDRGFRGLLGNYDQTPIRNSIIYPQGFFHLMRLLKLRDGIILDDDLKTIIYPARNRLAAGSLTI